MVGGDEVGMGGPGTGASLGLGAGLDPVDALPPATCSLCR